MTYSLQRVSGPTVQPLTVEMVKSHLNMEDLTLTDQETELLELKIRAARIEAETALGRLIGPQVWTIALDHWPYPSMWRLPLEPLISVDSIEYTDDDGAVTVYDADDYLTSVASNSLWLKRGSVWPSVILAPQAGVKITATFGLEPEVLSVSPLTVRWPDNIVLAMLYRIGTHQNIREETILGAALTPQKTGIFEALLAGDRVLSV